MANDKTITCDIKETIDELVVDDKSTIFIGKLSWNGRNVRGIDIRNKDAEGVIRKGVTIPFNVIDSAVISLVKAGYGGGREKILEGLTQYESSLYTSKHFDEMFNGVQHEVSNYTRDKYGYLINVNGQYVIEKYKK